MASLDKLTIYVDDKDAAVCLYGPVIYCEWRESGSVATAEVAEAAVADLIDRYGDGRRLLYAHRSLDRPGFRRSPSELRNAMVDHFRRHEERFLAAAVAVEAGGIGGAMTRAVGAGVVRVLRSQVKTEWFADARDGVRWLSTCAHDVSPFDAERMLSSLADAGLCRTDPVAAAGQVLA